MQTAPAPVAITEFSKARELRHMMPEDRRERSYWMAWGIFALNVSRSCVILTTLNNCVVSVLQKTLAEEIPDFVLI